VTGTEQGISWRAVRAVARRDLTLVATSKPVVLPLVIVPVLLLVALPLGIGLLPGFVDVGTSDVDLMLARLPERILAGLPADPTGRVVVLSLVYLLAPLYLILPLMVAAVVAADSFAGERERKTLEALLHAPLTDRELLLAKVLAAWLPAVALGLVGAVVYGVVANIAAANTVGTLLFPNLMWTVLALWVGPAVAAVGLGTMVLVSARVKTFQEAYQLGGAVVLPVVLLVAGQAAGVLILSARLVFVLGAVAWAIAAVLLGYGARTFKRTTLGERL
jgi:ABC-2 type transport system permease protein